MRLVVLPQILIARNEAGLRRWSNFELGLRHGLAQPIGHLVVGADLDKPNVSCLALLSHIVVLHREVQSRLVVHGVNSASAIAAELSS